MAMGSLLNRFDIRVSVVYCLVATFWIVISDMLFVSLLLDNPALLQSIRMLKELGFVGVTTLALFGVMSVELRKRIQAEQHLQQERDMSPVGLVTLERKQAELALRQYNQHLTFMSQLDRDIINAHSVEAMTKTVLKHVRQLIACQRASVTLFDDTISTSVSFGLELDLDDSSVFQTYPRVPVIHNQNFELLKAGKVLIIPDLRLEAPSTAFPQDVLQGGIRATLSAPLLIQEKLIGHLSLASTTPNFFHPEHAEVASEIANQLAVAFHNTRLLHDIQTKNQRLKTLSARLVEAQEVERRHIARELHDEVGQTLTALSLMLAMQARKSTSGGSIDLAESQVLVGDLMKRVRDLSLDLRPSMLDDLGLIPALVWYFKRYEHQTEIMIDFKHRDVEHRYSPIIETTLYRIVQEALTNVARYAQVKRVSVILWETPDAIHAQIEDDGIGFDLEAVQAANKTGGLIGLHERAQLAGGTCEIESSVSAGTIVTARILLPSENRRSV